MILAHLDFNIPLQSSQERGLLVPSSINPDWRTCDFNAHEVSGNQKCPEKCKMQLDYRITLAAFSGILNTQLNMPNNPKYTTWQKDTKGYKRHARPNLPKSKLFEWERSWRQNKMPDHHRIYWFVFLGLIGYLLSIHLSACLSSAQCRPTGWINATMLEMNSYQVHQDLRMFPSK